MRSLWLRLRRAWTAEKDLREAVRLLRIVGNPSSREYYRAWEQVTPFLQRYYARYEVPNV